MLLMFALIGMVSRSGIVTTNWQLGVLLVILAAWYVNATTVNDISDETIDAINLQAAKGRPLVHKQASIRELWILNGATGLMALAGALLLGKWQLLVVLIGLMLNYIYSLPPLQLSHRGYIAPLLLPIAYVGLPYVLGSNLESTQFAITNSLLIASLYIGFIGRIILKDIRDIKGDRKHGKNTFVVMHGKLATYIVSAICLTIGNGLLMQYVAPNLGYVIAFELLYVLMGISLWRLARTRVHDEEQIYIGLLAKAANGLLVTLLVYLSLQQQTAPDKVIPVLITSLLFSSVVIHGLIQPKQVVLGYRG